MHQYEIISEILTKRGFLDLKLKKNVLHAKKLGTGI